MRVLLDRVSEFHVSTFGKQTNRSNANAAQTLIEFGFKAWLRSLDKKHLPPQKFAEIDEKYHQPQATMTARLPDDIIAKVRALAEKERRAPSGMLRELVFESLAEHRARLS